MSYDLFFRAKSTAKHVGEDLFRRYFSSRPHYRLENSQAWYENQETGVYFSFDYNQTPDDEFDPELEAVTFNINFFRPHVFALEAEPELSAFVHHFDLLVSDPQNNGMGEGEYSRRGFLDGWNAGNEFAYQAVLRGQQPEYFTMPSPKIRYCWQWNLIRPELEAQYAQLDVFVPRIFLLSTGGRASTAVVWGDGVAIALPDVDYLIMPRQEFAPFNRVKTEGDEVFLRFEAAESILADYPSNERPLPHRLLDYDTPPAKIVRFFKEQQTFQGKLQGISLDRVLDEETCARMKNQSMESSDQGE